MFDQHPLPATWKLSIYPFLFSETPSFTITSTTLYNVEIDFAVRTLMVRYFPYQFADKMKSQEAEYCSAKKLARNIYSLL